MATAANENAVLSGYPSRPYLCLSGTAYREITLRGGWVKCKGNYAMSCAKSDIRCLTIGDDLRVFITVNDSQGNPIDITDANSIEYQMFKNYGSPTVITKVLGTDLVVNGTNQFYFDLTAAETATLSRGQYKHEAQVITAGNQTYTVVRGTVTMLPQQIGA